MGTCSSLYKNREMAGRISLAKKASPPAVREYDGDAAMNDGGISAMAKAAEAAPPNWTPSYGSKDEAFFDSQAWLESDCEDFHSVNGEFTPSRGSTPNYQARTPGRGIVHKIYANGLAESQSQGQPSPRKKLAELFRENPNPPGEEVSPYKEEEVEPMKKKVEIAEWCCVPSFAFRLSYIERKAG